MSEFSKKTKSENIEDKKEQSVSLNSSNVSVFFKKDKKLFFLHKKSEKISAAIYLVTKHFSETEPLRLKMRNLAINMISKVNSLRASNEESDYLFKEIENISSELSSNLEIAFVSGMLSEMNIRVIQQEIHKLLDEIRNYCDNKGNMEDYKTSFFTVPFSDSNEEETSEKNKQEYIKDIEKDKKFIDNKDESIKDKTSQADDTKRTNDKEEDGSKGQNDLKNDNVDLKKFGPVAVRRNKRRSIIINLLKRKKEITIKEAAAVLSDCSEKTLQRELSALVEEGVLYKEGERRWTKYTLA